MKIEFIGVGEAFDLALGNTSLLLHSKLKLLIDCGYAVPQSIKMLGHSNEDIDAIYLSHFHADHTFGLPIFLVMEMERGRKKPLTIIGQTGLKHYIEQLVALSYPCVLDKLPYKLNITENNSSAVFHEFYLEFAESAHSIRNLAVSVTVNNCRIGYSGDGALTAASKKLFSECKVLIHEAYTFNESHPNHASAVEVFSFAKTLPKLETLVFTHISRSVRKNELIRFLGLCETSQFDILVPEPGDQIVCPK